MTFTHPMMRRVSARLATSLPERSDF